MHRLDQTIFALSSGLPPCAISVVRVSGPQAGTALVALAGKAPAPRVATWARLHDTDGHPIDEAMVLWFPGPASATGEDVAEFHVHGSRAVLAALFARLSVLEHVRAAEPGEFTRRAFENGKLDLTGAEALDDLIHADTDRQRRQALRQLRGMLGERARHWRAQIVDAMALIEAGIDFSDEADVAAGLVTPALEKIRLLQGEIKEVLAAQGQGERLRDGLVVAIAGAPNVGKSTLMNQMARREVAIVSPHAGTTRDVIEVSLDLDGYPVTLIDTAGIRETDDAVEQEGIRRARARASEADLVLWLVDDQAAAAAAVGSGATCWMVRTKVDLAPSDVDGREIHFQISAKRGDGLSELIAAITAFAGERLGSGEGGLIGRQRHRELLRETAILLRRSIEAVNAGEEFVAEDLRAAADFLGRILGRVDTEDILDKIFRDFCIGK